MNTEFTLAARDVIRRCREIAACSEEPDRTTRTFLSPPMRDVHVLLGDWMRSLGMDVDVDAAGNLRGMYAAAGGEARRLIVGSHLDTVPNAGAFDGILGVVMGIAMVESLGGHRPPFAIEIAGFSEEEGVRFGVPFIGSRALVGEVDDELLQRRDAHGDSVADVIRAFGLDPAALPAARVAGSLLGYLELHIEQGPVLEALGIPVGIVDAIAGQSRLVVTFAGAANHAGTTPMTMRRDAVAGAAEWVGIVERKANATPGLVATVGRIEAEPGAGNVIAGVCRMTLDIRHASDDVRVASRERLLDAAEHVAARRGLRVTHELRAEQPATPMDFELRSLLEHAAGRSDVPAHHLVSGAGHDAMILARHMPTAMLFVRTPGGISHHPDESVLEDDVAAALAIGTALLADLERRLR